MSLALSACGSGSGGDSVPGAPTIGAATAGDGSASIAFTAPGSAGSAPITAYTATCTAGSSSKAGSGTASPITVSSLTNDTAYTCSVTATNSVGTGAASATVAVTPTAGGTGGATTTAGVACDYSTSAFNSTPSVNATATATWSCSGTTRTLTANGLPDHDVGTFPNADCPNTISSQTVSVSGTLLPAVVSSTGTSTQIVGYALNGVKFDPGTAGTCNDSGSSCSLAGGGGTWRIEALGQTSFNFGTDTSNAHVQPTGEYHYHGMPEGFITKLGGGSATMTLVGWASDGFPIYARYGHVVASDASSALKVLTGSYQTKASPDANRPATSLYPMGTFGQDWEYVAGSGDLDECNGRTGVTPEFPDGIYHYMITDTYPFIQRCITGTGTGGGGGGGGGGMPPPPGH
jgi:hypothetical protein